MLTGQTHEQEGEVEVYASSDEKAERVGKLKTISYDRLYKKLVLVPVGDISSEGLPGVMNQVAGHLPTGRPSS